jgi:hypothetical protein
LPDIAFYSRNERPYDFKVLPTTCMETSGKWKASSPPEKHQQWRMTY